MEEGLPTTPPAPTTPVVPVASQSGTSTRQTSPTTPPIGSVVPATEQPNFQSTPSSPVHPPQTSPAVVSSQTKSDWRLYGMIGFFAFVVFLLGGYILYNEFLLSRQPIAPDGTAQAENPVEVSPAPQLHYDTPGNFQPPEGEPVLPPPPSPKPALRETYNNYQYTFSFSYQLDDAYQKIMCPSPNQQYPNSEKKQVFYDSSQITSNDDLVALCEKNHTTYKAKIMVSETPLDCLGEAIVRSVGGVVSATQCTGKTTSVSSLDASTSLLIPQDGTTILIEVNAPEYLNLIRDVVDTFAFEVSQPPNLETF